MLVRFHWLRRLAFVSWIASLLLVPSAVLATEPLAAGSFDSPPPPDLLPWFVTRRFELGAVALLAFGTLAVDLFRSGGQRSFVALLGRVRLATLIGIFGVVALWGAETQRRRTARSEWHRSLHVAVTLMSMDPIDERVSAGFAKAAKRATKLMFDERRRHTPRSGVPFWLHVFGPAHIAREPPRPLDTHDMIERAQFRYQLGRYLTEVDRSAHVTANRFDVRVYVLAHRPRSSRGPRFVEGIGEAHGELGLVEVDLDESMIDAAWTAVLHELLHTVGARDKYDPYGHALLPGGLADPALMPLYPQQFAEIMVGEIPLSPTEGLLPSRLEQVRVGAVTAREIGWK